MAGGKLLFGAAAVALAVAARARSRAAQFQTGLPPGTTPGTGIRVDPFAVLAASGTPAGVNSATLNVVREDAKKAALTKTALEVVKVTGSIISSVTGTGMMNVLVAVFQNLGTGFTAVVSIIGVAIAVLVIASGIFNQFNEERTRMRMALMAVSGGLYTVNTWEFRTVEMWLKQMNVVYSVTSVADHRLDTEFYADRQMFKRSYNRYALVNVKMDPTAWVQMQLLARCAVIDYLRRVGFFTYYYGINWGSPLGSESPPPPLPPPPVNTWVDSAIVTTSFTGSDGRTYYRGSDGKTYDSPQMNVPHVLWNEFPMIGDATPNPLVPAGYGSTAITAPAFYTPAKTGAANYAAAVSSLGAHPIWKQLALNNHLQSIMTVLMLCRLDPRTVQDILWPTYAKHMVLALGMRPERDFVTWQDSKIVFDINYWGNTVIVDIAAIKQGRANAVMVIGPDGRQISTAGWS